MTNDTLSLEPCPFCGDPMRRHPVSGIIRHIDMSEENDCPLAGWATENLSAWNTRTPTPDTRVEALRPILADMAQQHLIAEMDDPDGDYEFAYECMVKNARKALALLDTPKAPVTDASGGEDTLALLANSIERQIERGDATIFLARSKAQMVVEALRAQPDSALVEALEPVLHWYQSDEEHARPLIDIVRDIVADLQSDRASLLRAHKAPASDTVGEPVAWRWRYVYKGDGSDKWTVCQSPRQPQPASPGQVAIEVQPLYAPSRLDTLHWELASELRGRRIASRPEQDDGLVEWLRSVVEGGTTGDYLHGSVMSPRASFASEVLKKIAALNGDDHGKG